MERPESAAQVVGNRTIFSDEQNDYRESFRRFLEKEVVPRYPEWERDQLVPKSLFTKCAEYGFLAMEVPAEFGGPGAEDWRFNVVLAEESVWAGVSDAMAGPLLHTDIVVPYITTTADDEQKRRWLPGVASGEQALAVAMTEPGTGSDLAAIATRGRRDGDGWIINGAKTFITNGSVADTFLVFARTGPTDSQARGVSAFIVERAFPGFASGQPMEKMGMRASPTTELFFEDMEVPEENLLGEEGQGGYLALQGLDMERAVFSGLPIGLIQGALDIALRYSAERKQFGQKIGNFQLVQAMIADISMQLYISRLLAYTAARKLDRGERVTMGASYSKLFASEASVKSTLDAIQILGGYGYMREYGVERLMRDAKLVEIGGGTSQIQRLIIAREVYKRAGLELT